jgi:hypothetical protein
MALLRYKRRKLLSEHCKNICILTGNPDISEYFLAGLKLGGALTELSKILKLIVLHI